MAVAIASKSAVKASNTTTEITVTFATDGPSGISVGDLLILQIVSNTTGSTGSIATPTGWTQLFQDNSAGTSNRESHAVFYRVAQTGDTAVVTSVTPDSTTAGLSAIVIRITGWDGVTANILSTSGTRNETGVNTYAVAGTTTAAADCLVLWLMGGGANLIRTTDSYSLGAEEWDSGSDPGSAASCSAASLIQAGIGASGANTFGFSGSLISVHGGSVVVRPSVSGVRVQSNRRLTLDVG